MDTSTIADGARLAARSALERLKARDVVAGEYPVYLDRAWVAALNAARERLALAEGRGNKLDAAAARAEVEGLEAQEEDKVLTFKFRALGPVEYEELLSNHRPVPEQVERAKAAGAMFPPQWNTDTFPRALIAKTLVSPELAEEDVRELFDGDAFAAEEGAGPKPSLLTVIEFKEMVNVALTASTVAPKLEG
jgi:hypothetical protein